MTIREYVNTIMDSGSGGGSGGECDDPSASAVHAVPYLFDRAVLEKLARELAADFPYPPPFDRVFHGGASANRYRQNRAPTTTSYGDGGHAGVKVEVNARGGSMGVEGEQKASGPSTSDVCSLALGSTRTGLGFHQHPGPAFNGLVFGHKRWFFLPPGFSLKPYVLF